MISKLPQLQRCEKGTTAVEFAIIAVPLIMLTAGTIEVGRALVVWNDMAHRADMVERSILIREKANPSDPKPYIETEEGLRALTTKLKGTYTNASIGELTTETVNGVTNNYRTITLEHNIQLLIPFFDGSKSPVTITAQRKVLVLPSS